MLTVFGHVLALSPLPRKRYRQNVWTNTLALIRLFVVKPMTGARVRLRFLDHEMELPVETDGFFRFQWQPTVMPGQGWHKVEVALLSPATRHHPVRGQGKIYVPFSNQYAFISDIDDTFLISHSSNLRKRLFVLLTENAYSRRPFDGVVKHYQALAAAHTLHGQKNPFFYVSSSEWNLYDYIDDFVRKNELPEGIYLLGQLKRFSQMWKTGQSRHGAKFFRIARILEAYPDQMFVLLGDDSQQDPAIYASIAEHFPGRIKAVYLRNVFEKNMSVVKEAISKIEKQGISVCHFRHSRDAILHSIDTGLLPAQDRGNRVSP